MAYDPTKPVTGGALIAADIRENFRALKDDGIVTPGEYASGTYLEGGVTTLLDKGIYTQTYTKVGEFRVVRNGVINTRIGLAHFYPSGYSYGRIYINGSPIGTERWKYGVSWQYWTEDINVAKNDLVQLYMKSSVHDPANNAYGELRMGISNPIVPTVDAW